MTDIKGIGKEDMIETTQSDLYVKGIIDNTPDSKFLPHCADCGRMVIYDNHWLEVDVEDKKVIFCIVCGMINNEFIKSQQDWFVESGFLGKLLSKVKSIIFGMRKFK